MSIPDAPWITEAIRTGHSVYGYWNSPPREEDAIYCDRCRDSIYLGQDYFDIDGEVLCESCFDYISGKWRRTHGD